MKDATNLIHTGESADTRATPSLLTPIYETSTFVCDSVADDIKYQEGKLNGYLYSRYENPTVVAVEQKLAAVDGAEASLLFSSGMAAISTALRRCSRPAARSCVVQPFTAAHSASSRVCSRSSASCAGSCRSTISPTQPA